VLNHLSLLEKLDSRVLLCRVLVNRLKLIMESIEFTRICEVL
jgi:hypothetical protein